MANPTTNFGWVMPTSSSLVTNLPADFNTFGQAVDTSMAELKGGTTGQILSKTSATDMDFTWITPNPGDITSITATSPLSGGGTSGDVTIGILSGTTSNLGAVQLSTSTSSTSTSLAATASAVKSAYDLADAAIAKSIVDAKGDLVAATAADTVSRLAVGANGTVLTADSAEATGLKWATPATPTSGLTLISRQTFSSVAGTGTTFDNVFTSTYKSYVAVFEGVYGATAGSDFYLQMRYAGPTTQTATYYSMGYINALGNGTVTGVSIANAAQFKISNNMGTSGDVNTGEIFFNRVGNTSEYPIWNGTISETYGVESNTFAGWINVARTYTGFILSASSGNITGTVAVYGLATA